MSLLKKLLSFQLLCFRFLLAFLFFSNNSFSLDDQPQANRQERLQELNQQIRSKYNLPSLGILFFSEEKTLLSVQGNRHADQESPVSESDLYHLGSNTKSMTASLMALLAEEGKLSFQSKIKTFFPELKNFHADYAEKNIADLLAHRAGMPEDIISFLDSTLWKKIRKLGSETQEGRKFCAEKVFSQAIGYNEYKKELPYGNLAYIIAGLIIEKVTKKSWEENMQDYIFNPLNMKSCGFGAPGKESDLEITAPWQHLKVRNKTIPIRPGLQADNPPTLRPAGGVHCSLNDWLKYLKTHFKDSRFFKKESLEALHQKHTLNVFYTAGGWFRVNKEKTYFLEHTGTNTMSSSYVLMNPIEKNGFLLVSNILNRAAFKEIRNELNAWIQFNK